MLASCPCSAFPRTPDRCTLMCLGTHARGPPQQGIIARDVSIAISQFAPGSQTVKDKALHDACGITEFFPYRNRVHTRSGFTPPLPRANTTFLGMCRACQSVQFSEEKTGGQLCKVCGRSEVEFIDAREPKGFFTDFTPEDYHGVFEWTPRSTIPTLAWDNKKDDETLLANCSVSAFVGDVLSVNDNDGKGGFEFQRAPDIRSSRMARGVRCRSGAREERSCFCIGGDASHSAPGSPENRCAAGRTPSVA